MLSADTVLQERYRIVSQLGQGGMGAVYEAVDERLDTIVALKETLFTDEKLRKQFEREARLLARLHHQALPRVSDHFNESEGQFLVMQYIAGEDLAAMLTERNGPFPEDEVIRWADQLCDALDYLHTQDPQIIHRDIKPQNLKLTARGQIVLLDFGLAKGSAGQLTAVTTSASIFGYTPNYAPLEQVQGMGTDARSDLYSLAATLFHLVTNVKPPDALSRAAAVVNGEPDPLPLANEISPSVSSSFANVLAKGMSLKRDDRFPAASAMRGALHVAAEHPLGDAGTLLTSGSRVSGAVNSGTLIASERATRLVSSQTQQGGPSSIASEAQTLVAGEATNVREPAAAGGAPVRTNRTVWVGAAILLVLIVGCAAGFYAYRNRNQSTQSAAPSAPAESQPVQSSQPANSPGAGSTQSEQLKANEARTQSTKTESAAQRAANKKSEVQQKAETIPPQTPATGDPGHDANRDQNRDQNRDPNRRGPPDRQPSPFDPYRPPPGQGPGHPPRGIPEVKTLPNGTKVIRQPDGSMIFVNPKGETRIVPPRRQRKPDGNTNQP
jgi:serine/threonine protein kinase